MKKNRSRKIVFDVEAAEVNADDECTGESSLMKQVVSAATRVGRPTRTPVEDVEAELVGAAGKPSPAEVRELEAKILGDLSSNLLKEIKLIRAKSGRLQGGLSGRLKSNVALLHAIVDTFVERLEVHGDPAYAKIGNVELKAQLRAAKRDVEDCRSENATLEAEIRSIRAETRRGAGPLLRTGEPMDVGPPATRELQSPVVRGRRRSFVGLLGVRGSRWRGLVLLPPVLPRCRALGPYLQTVVGRGVQVAVSPESVEYAARVARIDLELAELEKLKESVVAFKSVRDATGRAGVGSAPPPSPSRSTRKRGRVGALAGELLNTASEEGQESSEPSRPPPLKDGWVGVARRPRRVRGGSGSAGVGVSALALPPEPDTRVEIRAASLRGRVPRRGPLRSAAVTITGQSSDFDYGKALVEARSRIPLEELNIQLSKIRRTANGGRIIEIPGADSARKADDLAARLREVFGSTARVARPSVRGELRLSGLDDSVTQEEVQSVIAREGQCTEDSVRTGPIRVLNNGLGAVWIQCPLSAAFLVSRSGKLSIGWSVAKVELLKGRPVQCFKCWEFGHVRFACKSPVDRSGLCFKCGVSGHPARECGAVPRCAICSDRGRDCAHRVGSDACSVRAVSGSVGLSTSTRGGSDATRRVAQLNPEDGVQDPPM